MIKEKMNQEIKELQSEIKDEVVVIRDFAMNHLEIKKSYDELIKKVESMDMSIN